jgi:hypothetical protein
MKVKIVPDRNLGIVLDISLSAASYKGKDLLDSLNFNKKASWEIMQKFNQVRSRLGKDLDLEKGTKQSLREYIMNYVLRSIDELTDFFFDSDITNKENARPSGRAAYFRDQLKIAFITTFDIN